MSQTQNQQYSLQTFNQKITNEKTQEYLSKVLGERKATFIGNVTALVGNDIKLQQCEPLSVMYSAIKATTLGLPLDQNLGFAYVIPFWNGKKGCTEAQFQIGTRGYLQLAMRTNMVKTINVREVKEGEITGEDFVTGEMTFKRREHREELKTIGYVAYIELINGFRKMSYKSKEEIQSHALKYSQTYANEKTRSYSPWSTDFDAMAQKTTLKLLLAKYAPMSVEMHQAISIDQAVISQKGDNIGETEVTYIDNDETIPVIEPKDVAVETQSMVDEVMKKSKATLNQQ